MWKEYWHHFQPIKNAEDIVVVALAEPEIVGDVADLEILTATAAATEIGPQYDNLGERIATN